jgi:serine phosphatase RsbU (regulator of sigma subunit)
MPPNGTIIRLLFLLLLSGVPSFGMTQNKVSQWTDFNNPKKADSVRFKAIDDFIWDHYLFENPDSALYFSKVAYSFSLQTKNIYLQAVAMNTKGTIYYVKDDFANAVKYYLISLKKYQVAKDELGLGSIYNNLGNIYKEQGDLAKAVDYYRLSLKIAEKLKDYPGVASSFNNIGILYAKQDKYDKAVVYYKKSIRIRKKINDRNGLSAPLNNIGNVLESKKDYIGAIRYYTRSLLIDRECKNDLGEITSMGNIAGVYTALILTDRSQNKILLEEYYQKSFDLSSKIISYEGKLGNNTIILTAYMNLAILLDYRKEPARSIVFSKKALKLAEKIGSVGYIRDAADLLYQSFKKRGDCHESLAMFELATKMKDSVLSIENTDEIIHQEYKYEYDKQVAKDSVIQLHEKQLTAAKFQNEKTQRFALYGGLSLVLIFAGFLLNRYKIVYRQKEIITSKEQEAQRQKKLLEVKNKEITDSINYAKRIQAAILPAPKIVKEYLKESFILYKPRDIVAGDFYWMEQIEGGLIFAAADCTGHGVPGAMVSVVCHNALNRCVREYGLDNPGVILDTARDLIISEFEKSDDEMKDGMDISLCSLTYEKTPENKSEGRTSKIFLKWAGANNPLWILRNNTLIEYKGDKQPIGLYLDPKPFICHTIELHENDLIYIFTDGYQDQFGGPKNGSAGKKFKSSRMKDLFLSIAEKSMEDQRAVIDATFEAWKGELEQVDDVCVIGVRV